MGDVSGIIALVISIITAVILFLTFVQDHRRRKKQATIEYYQRICELLYEISGRITKKSKVMPMTFENISADPEFLHEVRYFLTTYERFCVGINTGIYDIHIVERMTGNYLPEMYEKLSSYIGGNRRDQRKVDSYIELQEVIRKIDKIRTCYTNTGRM